MSYAVWDFLSGLPGIIIMVLAVHWLAGYRRAALLAAHLLIIAASSFARIFAPSLPPGAFWLLGMVAFIVPAALFCRGKLHWRILCAGMVLLANMLADYLAYMAVLAFFPDAVLTPQAMPVTVLLFGKGCCAVLLILFCLLLLALKPSALNAGQPEIIRKFFLFPASQVFVLGTLYGYIVWYEATAPLLAFGVASFVFCVAADIGMFFALRELGRKYALELENAALQSQLQSQISYYQQLQAGMEQTKRLRHDFDNQLQTVYTLLQTEGLTEAKAQLETLSAAIKRQGLSQFTDNPVAEAVLRDKARLCAEQDVTLNIKAELPARVAIDGVDLCAVFSNLLDNAIHACAAAAQPERFIDLSTAVRSGYLIVKTKNSAAHTQIPAVPNKTAEHGLGLQILSGIAQRYCGKLETSAEGGIFEATIWLALDADDASITENIAAPA